MKETFKTHYAFGKTEEERQLNTLRQFFNDTIAPEAFIYQTYDFKGKEYHYEMKSRKFNYAKHSTTLLPCSKIVSDKERFIFNFTDGIYYIEYDKELFKTFRVEMFQPPSRPDKIDPPKLHYFIPITALKLIMKKKVPEEPCRIVFPA